MTLLLRVGFLLFLGLAVLSWLKKDALPAAEDILPQLQRPPQQKSIEHGPLHVEKDGTRYTIQPLFSYSLRGLVVSYHDSSSWLDYMHGAWGDTLNVRDLCVLWGENVKNGLYHDFSFKSGDFTCFFKTNDHAAWSVFRTDQISNNHLLAATAQIQDKIAHAEHGDQIAFKGYLATYSHGGGFSRGTSTRRDDTGNGACETVFVTHFTMLRKANVFWRTAWDISLFGLFITLLAGTVLFVWDAVSPSYVTADELHHSGVQLAAKGKLRRALNMLNKALDIEPDRIDAYRDRALILERLGQFSAAEQDTRKADSIEARNNPQNFV